VNTLPLLTTPADGGSATTPTQRHILSHAIGGWTRPTRALPEPHRNRYCAPVPCPDVDPLVAAGLMQDDGPLNGGRMRYLSVTPLGFQAIGVPWPKGWAK
jgi:hypothetical protein